MRLSDEYLRGRTVIGADGQAIGEVETLFLESQTWNLESIRVKLRKGIADQIGATHSMFRSGNVEIPARLLQSVGDAVILSVSADDLRRVLPSGEAGQEAPQH